jgi:hypothetical protein
MADASISVKVDGDTKREIRIAAAKRDMNMSEYLRFAVSNQLKSDNADEGNRNQAPQTAD